jgi:hypothetical protein
VDGAVKGLPALLALALLPLLSGCFTTRLWSRSRSGSQAHRVEDVYLPFKTAQGDVVVPYNYIRTRSDGLRSYVDGRVTLTAEDLAGLAVFVRPSELNRGDVDAILAHEAKLRGTEYPPPR